MKSKQELDDMLGTPRFATYLTAVNGDVAEAEELYRWNTRLAGALHSQLSYFEVLYRNAVDRALQEWNNNQCGHREWSLQHQAAELLYNMFNRPMAQARRRAELELQHRERLGRSSHRSISHDDVLAQFTLGNWSNLLGEFLPAHTENAKLLWRECLHEAFPRMNNDDESRIFIGKRVESLRRLRNRVSHRENLLSTNVKGRLNDMLAVLGAINENNPTWAMEDSTVRRILHTDPRKR